MKRIPKIREGKDPKSRKKKLYTETVGNMHSERSLEVSQTYHDKKKESSCSREKRENVQLSFNR